MSAYGEQPPLATILQRLQKLQHLTVWHWADTALQLLGNLAPQLTQLRKVNVMMHRDAPASALVQAIPFLLRLPSLDQLSLQTKDDAEQPMEDDNFSRTMQHIAKASKLTSMAIRVSLIPQCPCVCRQLAQLSNLQHLDVSSGLRVTAAGAQLLAELTSLTKLCLGDPGVDDAGLSMLALKLTNLSLRWHLHVTP